MTYGSESECVIQYTTAPQGPLLNVICSIVYSTANEFVSVSHCILSLFSVHADAFVVD